MLKACPQTGRLCQPGCQACYYQPGPYGTRNPDRDLAEHQRFARAVKKRDGYRCTRCGSTHHIVAHHRTPLSQGGTNDPANGETLCQLHHKEADRYA